MIRRGQWRARCRYRDYTGGMHPLERYGRTKEQAVNRLREAIRDWSGPQTSGRSFVRDAADDWLADLDRRISVGEIAPGTGRNHHTRVRKWIKPGIGGLRLHEVTPVVLNKMLVEVRDKSSAGTAGQVKTTLGLIFAFVVERGALSVNPVRDAATFGGSPKSGRPVSLTREEARKLIADADSDPRARGWDLPDLFRVGLGSGLRLGEVLGLRWSDVDFAGGTLRVRKAKTPKGTRVVAIPRWCVRTLEARPCGDSDAPVFPRPDGKFRATGSVDKMIQKFRGEHGWPDTLVFHTLRKTTATAMDEHGMSARKIADALGHSRPSITQDVYMGRSSVSWESADALESFDPSTPPG